jgi:hypothetical protein
VFQAPFRAGIKRENHQLVPLKQAGEGLAMDLPRRSSRCFKRALRRQMEASMKKTFALPILAGPFLVGSKLARRHVERHRRIL